MDTSEENLSNLRKMPSDNDFGNVSFTPVANVGEEMVEKPVSVRLEKLRSYYTQLGKAREMMERELSAQLAGETVDGEIEK